MEEHIDQKKMHILTEYSQKVVWEKDLRTLWRTCFGDPQHYEDFYFSKVYTNNKVYALKDKGMIHVNSYRCNVMGQAMVLPYIVGVATEEKHRRQGVMRNLLEQVCSDLYDQRIPFVYLMPAKEEYYLPFGFRSVSKRVEHQLVCDEGNGAHFLYVSYKEIRELQEECRLRIFAEVNRWLQTRYDIYAIHDEAYYELLYAEKICQSGDVIFCFDEMMDVEHLQGVFAYAMDDNIPYVEQMITRQSCQGLTAYFEKYRQCKVVEDYPYMLRVIHRDAFLEIFGERLKELCDTPLEELTDEQMITTLFEAKNRIYFAEIV